MTYQSRNPFPDSDTTNLGNAGIYHNSYQPAGSNPKDAFRFGMWIRNRNLDISFLWQPRLVNAVQTRRIMTDAEHSRWPFWAWSGWKGAFLYQDDWYMFNGLGVELPMGSLVTAWNMVDEDGTIVQLDVKQTYCLLYTIPNHP
ncbi:hypothetical protein J3R82DRAFT_7572 [Butyriboletus roseoflavus]|nr:hypothetical protein J3R82DRAFT_7572 [Butyriboletus roseoflavus]